MLFNSVEYIVLLFLSLVAYWSVPWLLVRQWIVLLASVYFYMSWSPVFILMLLALIVINWILGKRVKASRNKTWLIVSCTVDLGLLAYFKYANFFIDNLEALGRLRDPALDLPHFSVILPLGVSFYVFELISYQADLFRGKIRHENSLLVFSIFVLFFPHLIAGPICRAGQFMPQIHKLQRLEGTKFYNGLYMFLAGFALKCGIADGVSPYVNVIFSAPGNYSGFDNLMAAIGFGIQILCDFWGYSLMALGAALLFGYVLPHNFNLPYAALSIRDFWRRWHITLSNWLRDYLYIAMGGSRTDAQWKIQRNLGVTMLLGGLWHGASWNFIVWGGIHGAALALNRWFETSFRSSPFTGMLRWRPIAWSLTMATVFAAWVFFRAAHFDVAVAMLTRIVTPAEDWFLSKLSPDFYEIILLYLPLQWLVHTTTYKLDFSLKSVFRQIPAVTVLTAFAVIYYVNGNEFIYFQF